MSDRKDTDARLHTRVGHALQELETVARELLAASQSLAPEARLEAVELPVVLSFHRGDSAVAKEFRAAEAQKLVELLRARVREALLNATAFERGHIYCLRCESSRCGHSQPPSARSVFAGYEPTGRPEWVELDRLLHRRRDARLERLYQRGREVVALALHRDELYAPLLPGFEESRWRCYILGELVVGYFVPDGRDPTSEPMALCVQIVRTQREPDGAVLGINLVGQLPADVGTPIAASAPALDETVFEGLPDALRQLQREIGVFFGRGGERAPGIGVALERLTNRVHALLKDAARDLEHRTRLGGRRTQHARMRSDQGARPTQKAFEDARGAAPDAWLEDREKGTRLVLGPKGRVHFFALGGKHVTSIAFPGHAIQARLKSKRWVQLEREAAAAFKKLIDAAPPTTEPAAAPPAGRAD